MSSTAVDKVAREGTSWSRKSADGWPCVEQKGICLVIQWREVIGKCNRRLFPSHLPLNKTLGQTNKVRVAKALTYPIAIACSRSSAVAWLDGELTARCNRTSVCQMPPTEYFLSSPPSARRQERIRSPSSVIFLHSFWASFVPIICNHQRGDSGMKRQPMMTIDDGTTCMMRGKTPG